jgi:hypothetical protein
MCLPFLTVTLSARLDSYLDEITGDNNLREP